MHKLTMIALGTLAVGCGGGAAAPGGNGSSDPPPTDPGPAFPCAGADEAATDGLGGDMRCFPAAGDPGGDPLVVIEYAFEQLQGVDAVHIRLTFDPAFNDNTYGDTAVGWDFRDKGHTFQDLARSDHADVVLLDAQGDVVFDLSLDYISEVPTASCGWGSLGPFGGDGKIRAGDPNAILAWSSSLDRNLNERGYCDYLDNSPATDQSCTPNNDAPNWDYRIVYELWVRRDAFSPIGFGTAHMDAVHASPSKAESDTVSVEPGDCPPGWCNDPDGCDGGGGGSCQDQSDCPTGEFCGEGTCVPVVL